MAEVLILVSYGPAPCWDCGGKGVYIETFSNGGKQAIRCETCHGRKIAGEAFHRAVRVS